MKYNYRRVLYVFSDIFLCLFALAFAAFLRHDLSIADSLSFFGNDFHVFALISVIPVLVFGLVTRTYRSVYLGIGTIDVLRQFVISVFSGVSFMSLSYATLGRYSLSITFLFTLLFFLFSTASRSLGRISRWENHRKYRSSPGTSRVIIIGAGSSGASLIKLFALKGSTKRFPVALLDDDPEKRNLSIGGVRVCGKVRDAAKVAALYEANEIIIAIPSASPSLLSNIYEDCKDANLPIRLFGNMVDYADFLSGSQSALRDISIEDILFRDHVYPDMTKVAEFIDGKTVLVTGGCGSIGSEICRQVLSLNCRHLVIVDINENGLYHITNELLKLYPKERFSTRLVSVRDKTALERVFKAHKLDLVIHAAAHKHVPLMEENVFEAVKNNVFGTKNVLDCCVEHKASRFILISTDKAVNPTNIMGATKRIAELLVQRYNGNGCETAAVRFGNVLGSEGSVIPLFRSQIAAGGPVTVTHKDITRYFMMIPEAVSLVLSAGAQAKGGELFVLNMGSPVKIYDLACKMISLAGLTPGKDIEIKITGLRPGEKLYEELSLDFESVEKTQHDKIFVVHSPASDKLLEENLAKLASIIQSGGEEKALREIVFSLAKPAASSENATL